MSAKQKRQGTRMCIKRELDKILPIIDSKVDINLKQLELSLKILDNFKTKLEMADSAVLAEISDDQEIEQEISDSALYNYNLLEVISSAEIMLKSVNESNSLASNVSSGNNLSGPNFSRNQLRLPKLELPAFSGEPLDWQTFWDSYENSVHNNPNLSDIDKFNYLRGLLTGEALKAIDGFRLTAANYNAAISTLTERFGNKQTAIFAHFEAMLALPQSNHDISQLQSVSDACEQHIRSLVALGLDESTFGQVFTPIMLSKLPKFVKIELHRRNGSQNWSLTHLREWLKDEIRARELGERSFGDSRITPKNSHTEVSTFGPPKRRNFSNMTHRNNDKRTQSSTTALVSSAMNQTAKCAYCSDKHFSDACSKHPDIQSRRLQAKDLCFCCLGKGHRAQQCGRKVPCPYCKKTGHHRSLCYTKFGVPSESKTIHPGSSSQRTGGAISASTTTVAVSNSSKRTIMQTAAATILSTPDSPGIFARLLFDTAGSRTFITERKRRELELPYVGEEFISIAGFQSNKRRTAKYKMVEFLVRCSNGSLQQVTASVVPTITCPIQKLPLSDKAYPMLKNIALAEPPVAEPEFVDIDVLIGLDYYYEFVTNERIQCPDGPLLLSSKLGYIATGRVPTDSTGPETIAVMFIETRQQPSNFVIERYWDLEDIGIKECPNQLSGDDVALKQHSETLQRDTDGRYISRWPWKCKEPDLHDNYDVAYGRLTSLIKRIRCNPQTMDKYCETLEDQLKNGVIEEAPTTPSGPTVYYMPHHCVITPAKTTTKLRIVYDASSKSRKDNESLNDCLHRGPVLLSDLCGLLMRFRLHPVALVSDIEKAFLQIGLHEEERDVTRFLWVKDPLKPLRGSNVITYRFCRIPFGIISSPFILENTMCQHLLRTNGDVSLKILSDHYVDNIVTGEKDTDAAISHYHDAKDIFNNARMNLREWYSNDADVRRAFADPDKGLESEPKVLGLKWNYDRDTLRCESSGTFDDAQSKREILRSVAQVFDPLGLFSPVTVAGKMVIQDLWKAAIDWDGQLPDDIKKRWSKISSNLQSISSAEVPRFIGPVPNGITELHVFCDASTRACAAAVYLRNISDVVSCNLLVAKSRLSPAAKPQTIPRLELIAIVIGVRLLKFAEEQLRLGISRKFVWTDSQCALHWINRDKVSARFVENRLKEIRKHHDIHFKYVPSAENPADLSSRGCDTETLQKSKIWWRGPGWLTENDDSWPRFELPGETSDSELVLVVPKADVREKIVDETRFSSMLRLLRCIAYVLRFVNNARSSKFMRKSGVLSPEELGRAQKHIIIMAQQQGFPDLVRHKQSVWPKGIGRQLGLFKDSDGILRCSGRLQEGSFDYDTKYPILLPKDGHFTGLVIQDCHKRLLHAGAVGTLAQLRKQFWIVHGRNSVRRVIRACGICVRKEGGPYRAPPAPCLPIERLAEDPAFTNVGVDYLGPLLIKNADSSTRKVWICLYTCMVIRAIHLEMVEDLSAEHFLLSLRRFIATYGVPKLIVSDNGSQFRAGDKAIQKLWREVISTESVENFATNKGIKWDFIVEYAPWMGGFYERLVGVVKRVLRKVLHCVLANATELQTVLSEITAVVNSRPLTYVENEVGSHALTPAHFLAKGAKNGLPQFSFSSGDDAEFVLSTQRCDALIAKWKRLQAINSQFWKMWRVHYLLSLRQHWRERQQRNSDHLIPRIGSIVQLSETSRRENWKMGRISEICKSKDGKIRSVCVILPNGKRLRRPVRLLFPLEFCSDCESKCDSNVCAPNTNSRVRPPRRQAAINAMKQFPKQITEISQQPHL